MHDSPEAALRAYVAAFESLNVEAVVPFYDSPCLFIAPFGVSMAVDTAAARPIATAMIEHARSVGYRRTEIRDLRLERLADNLATLSGDFIRFGEGDAEVGRMGFTYIMRDVGAGWRFVVAVGRDPGSR